MPQVYDVWIDGKLAGQVTASNWREAMLLASDAFPLTPMADIDVSRYDALSAACR